MPQLNSRVKRPWPIGAFWYWAAVVIWFVALGLASDLLLAPIKEDFRDIFEVDWWIVYLFGIVPTWIILNFKPQAPDEWVVKLLLGSRIIQMNEHGPSHVLWPLVKYVRLPKSSYQNQYPANDNQIDWERNVDSPPAPDKVAPIRATTAQGTPEQIQEDPLNRRLTINLSDAVTFRIVDPIQFLLVLGGLKDKNKPPEERDGLDNARKQIEDVAVGQMVTEIGQHTAAWFIGNITSLNTLLASRTEKLVEENEEGPAWGVEIDKAQIVRYDLPVEVNKALRNVPKAAYEKQGTILTSEGEREKRINEGLGTAAARREFERAQLVGQAEGIERLLTSLPGLSDAQRAALLAANRLLEKEGKTIVIGESAATTALQQIGQSLTRAS